MCCFSGPVEDVSSTRIFARMAAPGQQLLAYEMVFAASESVAMILPIPTPANSLDDAVRFISLEGYPEIFTDLFHFFNPIAVGRTLVLSMDASPPEPLVVHEVGAFVASFVPSLADFTRLDPQFRIPAGTLDRVPTYADWGFVVFQLSATKSSARVHPMAFEFRTRVHDRLFFPTVHVHDGVLHSEAEMDHVLYAQGVDHLRTFETLPVAVHRRVSLVAKSEGLVSAGAKLSRRELDGTHPNEDIWATLLDA